MKSDMRVHEISTYSTKPFVPPAVTYAVTHAVTKFGVKIIVYLLYITIIFIILNTVFEYYFNKIQHL